jgi:regulator of replication initiation timing
MDAKLLQQIEWLWQHLISLDAENKILKAEIQSLKEIHSPNKK